MTDRDSRPALEQRPQPEPTATRVSQGLARLLFRPVDIASVAALRVLFGALALVSCLRFLGYGWVNDFFVRPRFHFKYWGFGWVEAWPGWGMYAHFVGLSLLSLAIMLGLYYRAAIVLFFLGWSYVALIDVTIYLNHYYLVCLLALLLAFLPAHGAFSLDAWRKPQLRRATLPAVGLYALRFQVGVVYTSAGLAKLGRDWLLEAQPLNIWFASLSDLPVLGPLLAQRQTALVAGWAGFLFDGTVAFFLATRRFRRPAFAALVVFHLLTGWFFPIGMFPAIMIACATVFFDPGWPRGLLRLWPALAAKLSTQPSSTPSAAALPACRPWLRPLLLTALAAHVVLQLALPLRSFVYEGNVLWHEQGMRFAWRVMVREKNASVTYVVRSPRLGREWHVSPDEYLQPYQKREFGSQPDLVWQLGQRIGADFRARGLGPVEVRAEVWASLNGRPPRLLLDPRVDLLTVGDSLASKPWILPAPTQPPLHLATVR